MVSLSQLPKWAIAGLAFPLICLNGWLLYKLGGVLHPIPSIVITASLIAFLLDYPIDWLEERGLARGLAVALVVLLAVLVTTILVVFLGPQVWQQLNEFALRLPGWIDQGKTQLLLLEDRAIFQTLPVNLDQLTEQAANQLTNTLQATTTQAISVTLSTLDSALNLLITAVLALLLVINGDSLWEGLLSWLPAPWRSQIRNCAKAQLSGLFFGAGHPGADFGRGSVNGPHFAKCAFWSAVWPSDWLGQRHSLWRHGSGRGNQYAARLPRCMAGPQSVGGSVFAGASQRQLSGPAPDGRHYRTQPSGDYPGFADRVKICRILGAAAGRTHCQLYQKNCRCGPRAQNRDDLAQHPRG